MPGIGSSSAFGGPCQTPTAERLAADGLRFNRFHTTALCSPTRQALLTGRNHHSVGMGGDHRDRHRRAWLLPPCCANTRRRSQTLKLNGYATAQFGKCHEVPVWQTSPVGPFDLGRLAVADLNISMDSSAARPTNGIPRSIEGTTPVEAEKTPEEGYHLVDDMTTKAINWIGQQKALAPDKPFFVYFAPGATHAPHHVRRNGPTSTKASSTKAGTSFAKRRSHGRRSWA